jgi:hypothetical protein
MHRNCVADTGHYDAIAAAAAGLFATGTTAFSGIEPNLPHRREKT